MKHPLVTLVRFFLLVSIVMAAVPSWSKVTVCVIGPDKVTVPIGKCGMPCCAAKAPAKSTARKDCCKPKASLASANAACPMASKSCRCETRYTITSSPPAATFDRTALATDIHPLTAILFVVCWEIPAPLLKAAEPGIRGVDAGPPRKVVRTPKQSRAPPFFV